MEIISEKTLKKKTAKDKTKQKTKERSINSQTENHQYIMLNTNGLQGQCFPWPL